MSEKKIQLKHNEEKSNNNEYIVSRIENNLKKKLEQIEKMKNSKTPYTDYFNKEFIIFREMLDHDKTEFVHT